MIPITTSSPPLDTEGVSWSARCAMRSSHGQILPCVWMVIIAMSSSIHMAMSLKLVALLQPRTLSRQAPKLMSSHGFQTMHGKPLPARTAPPFLAGATLDEIVDSTASYSPHSWKKKAGRPKSSNSLRRPDPQFFLPAPQDSVHALRAKRHHFAPGPAISNFSASAHTAK